MSNRDPDAPYESLGDALRFSLGAWLRERVHTSMPGIVRGYDPRTRRARVQPALHLLTTDGVAVEKPVVVDVPVLMPATRQFTLQLPLTDGDPVLLVCSERGLDEFKRTFAAGEPAPRTFALQDAVALPGFGPLEIGLPPNGRIGASFQSVNANEYVQLASDAVTLCVARTHIEITSQGIRIFATGSGGVEVHGNLHVTGDITLADGSTVDGVDVSEHRHGMVQGGTSQSGEPV